MPFEKFNYNAGDTGKQRLALEREAAIKDGRLPEWEAEQKAKEQGVEARSEPEPLHKMPDYRAGDPEKLQARLDNLRKMYPKKSAEETPKKKAA